MNNILSDILVKHDPYSINQGFELLVQQFDEGCMQEFIREFIQYGENISISPWIVLAPLNKSMDSAQLLSFIKQADFPQKNEWLFSFFVTLPEEKVKISKLSYFLKFKLFKESTYRLPHNYFSILLLFLIIFQFHSKKTWSHSFDNKQFNCCLALLSMINELISKLQLLQFPIQFTKQILEK